MKPHKLSFATAIPMAFFLAFSANAIAESELTSHQFFDRILEICGARFEGETTYPESPGEAFRDQPLYAYIKECSEEQIKVPFVVGQDHSRTWVLTRNESGVLLEHDHRHEDGTPDEITDYGGQSSGEGDSHHQSFPANEYTAKLIPEAATNVWSITLSDDGQELTYYLERHDKPRFKASLTRVTE